MYFSVCKACIDGHCYMLWLHSCQLSWNGWESPIILSLVTMASQLGHNSYDVLDFTLTLVCHSLVRSLTQPLHTESTAFNGRCGTHVWTFPAKWKRYLLHSEIELGQRSNVNH